MLWTVLSPLVSFSSFKVLWTLMINRHRQKANGCYGLWVCFLMSTSLLDLRLNRTASVLQQRARTQETDESNYCSLANSQCLKPKDCFALPLLPFITGHSVPVKEHYNTEGIAVWRKISQCVVYSGLKNWIVLCPYCKNSLKMKTASSLVKCNSSHKHCSK